MRNRPHGFDVYQVNVKTKRKIAQIFVAFSEKLNFQHCNCIQEGTRYESESIMIS